MTIEEYLARLRRSLGPGLHRRALAEVEAHLRESAAEVGEDEAVRRFGSPEELARELRGPRATRLAAVGAFVLLLSFVALYPVAENTLPPAPWPAGEQPSQLAWKQDLVTALLLFAAGAAAVGTARLRRANGSLLAATAVAVVAGSAAAIVGVVLSFEWADAVPGTPGWLPYVGFANVAVAAVAAALVLRAARAAS
ncbi:MAG TPA: hypothetical protein VFP31_06250 [Gaiellaceae bacterium]|nr:hypothetical protein [Gaiellaceae bacterium]